ncbi:hypothetical protein PHYPSEUDO_009544 [Phytophthora pseudosyringae]|uniref:Uncharacterized protein n=1 Tax=Phytophthora pseudosyringae TaxID=221518 RepID=A0A8T1WN37_9STRA|nr:hypothetical protein PHYPSEUDO_009544 [Phytophthora pseudosyringae]
MRSNPSWDADGVDDGPSSMDVLIQWLEVPGNAARWLEPKREGDGSRMEMAYEVYDQLLAHGINYRKVASINTKLCKLEHQLQNAECWLKTKGLRHYDASKKSEREVLQRCPYYPVLKSLLRPKRSAAVVAEVAIAVIAARTGRANCEENSSTDASSDVENLSSSDTDEEQPNVGFKRERSHAFHDEVVKHAGVEHKLQKIMLEGTNWEPQLKLEPDERREFLKLDLQVKRDEAIVVRAKARRELLDLSVPLADVDRLLPL